jgi:enoyl-[acyl-carrier protein] reductase II
MLKTKICDILGIEHPIILGGMAYIGDPVLCAAVSEAGGMGVLGSGNIPVSEIGTAIEKIKDLTDKPFGLNIFMKAPMNSEKVQIAADMGVRTFFSGIGNPSPVIDIIHDSGGICVPTVASPKHVKGVLEIGADAIICEGSEGGGHIGNLPTFPLLQKVVSSVDVPVVAAGGFGDGRGMAAALALGAQGLYMGTRFLACKESPAHQRFKDLLIKSDIADTTVTGDFTGMPMRVIANDFTREWHEKERQKMDLETLIVFGVGKLEAGMMKGNVEQGSLPAGYAAQFIKGEETAAEIVHSIVAEAEDAYKSMASNF